jgi:hypothetical protein
MMVKRKNTQDKKFKGLPPKFLKKYGNLLVYFMKNGKIHRYG